MFDKLKYLFFDRSFLVFLCVGVLNTLVGLGIFYFCLNVLGFSFWHSSFWDYFLGSVMSYFLNKRFAFHYQQTDWRSILRFALNIVVCYLIAFSIAKPVTFWCLNLLGLPVSQGWIENVAGLTGTAIFTIVNYLGQRFFAFAQSADSHK